jgi:N-lysine methyltransferase SETD6
VVNGSHQVPDEMTSFVRLLMMSAPEWEKRKRKTKLPKVKVDDTLLTIVADVVKSRLAQYPTTVEVGFFSKLDF